MSINSASKEFKSRVAATTTDARKVKIETNFMVKRWCSEVCVCRVSKFVMRSSFFLLRICFCTVPPSIRQTLLCVSAFGDVDDIKLNQRNRVSVGMTKKCVSNRQTVSRASKVFERPIHQP
jgi:hypothetical protein